MTLNDMISAMKYGKVPNAKEVRAEPGDGVSGDVSMTQRRLIIGSGSHAFGSRFESGHILSGLAWLSVR